MAKGSILCGNVLEVLKGVEDNTFTCCVTDPPYHLTQVSRGGSPRNNDPETPFGRTRLGSRGFMGQTWDGGDIAFQSATWKEILRVCKPGAILLSFGGSRTFHRIACAIEDAGWELRDVLLYLYGAGFPKSHDISKAIDKAAGAEREVVGIKPGHEEFAGRTTKGHINFKDGTDGYDRPWMHDADARKRYHELTAPATEQAKLWHGYGTALKPAFEPVIVAMKPLDGTFAQNAIEHGVSGLNIEECRIPTADAMLRTRAVENLTESGWKSSNRSPVGGVEGSRWPANVILEHTEDCILVGTKKIKGDPRTGGEGSRPGGFADVGADSGDSKPNGRCYGDADGYETIEAWQCTEDCPIRILDEQAGEKKSGKMKAGTKRKNRGGWTGPMPESTGAATYGDKGGPSRFYYCAKSSKKDRNFGCENLYWKRSGDSWEEVTEAEYNGTEEKDRSRGNVHPTVKPLDLMGYLTRLVKMPENNLLLDPFCGSGSTLVAAIGNGMDCVGIDQDPVSARIASCRIQSMEAGEE